MNLAAQRSPAARSGVDDRFVADEFLTLRGRAVRWELAAWSGAITQALARALAQSREDRVAALAPCFEEATIVAGHLGRHEDARRVAEAAVRFYAAIARQKRSAEALAFAVSALVGLGAAERAAGRLDEALLHLGRVRSLGLGAEIGAGLLRVSRAQWESVLALEPAAARSIALASATETLSALLAARRLEDVVSLALVSRRGATDPPTLEWARKEAALAALCHLGRPDEALALAARYTVEAGEGERLVFELRRAEVLACFGDAAKARALAEVVLGQLERKWRARPGTLEDVRLAARVARLCALLGEATSADFCWAALAEALAIGDVPLQAELLVSIVETDWDQERREDASDLLRAVALGSGYRLPAAERLLSPEDGPRSSRSADERAPGFTSLVASLCALDPSKRTS
ncbi:hypothetical protein [Polyangium jinanense]|uniref:Uncharacterized protein n=1 Tax=Polyangium jinanense TaxID=2829994 RepID=A0A9X4AR67_9BACT|nr:hypothetical protein [Polyangium jinanense]MDC3953087.1 hypothetical protein [Polyangium jinanense]MDC3979792.1 hypothetical protein [Polyangium jinanense]